jgi:AraC-like DNA-binding protein
MSGIVFSSGYIDGSVCLKGPLSEEHVTIGIALDLAPGTRHWLTEVSTGNLAAWMPGDDHDAFYTPGSLYAAVTLSAEHLESVAATIGVVLDAGTLGGTGIHAKRVSERAISPIRRRLHAVHSGTSPGDRELQENLLNIAVQHFARDPRPSGPPHTAGYARITNRARDYIHAHLSEKISIGSIAIASDTSTRTLHRAFLHVLGESPYCYVNRLRLHRIRHELASRKEANITITAAANRSGMSELGRMSGHYRRLFGEYPSTTLTRKSSGN